MKSYARRAHVRGLVVGVSRGVGSAVVSTLYARTGLPTLCLKMPIHQTESRISRAEKYISFLKVHYPNVTNLRVDLTPAFDQFVVQVPLTNEPTYKMVLTNTHARLRVTTLYYFAGLEGYIVVDTGSKIENSGVGFFTEYGDEGVDIGPIANLMKSEVYKLGEYLQVPQSILEAKPSGKLFGDDRGNEDQLKATYDELGWAMFQIGQGQTAEAFTGRQHEVFEMYTRLNRANQHKMQPVPICKINK